MMEHMQRVVPLVHVQPREAAPRATHGIKGPATDISQAFFLRECFFDNASRFLAIALRKIDKAQRTKGKGERLACIAGVHRNHVEASAAEVSSQPVRIWNSGDNAFSGNARLFFA